jgi:F0F1-type ATP synthase epsilon subunit
MRVVVLDSSEVVFEGSAQSVILPGESGAFEVLPFHKDITCRLISGNLFIDHKKILSIKRGAMKLYKEQMTVIAEEA